jgi:flagellar biosynthesis/type III secretory pathway M-ring protein FliF/YscJ
MEFLSAQARQIAEQLRNMSVSQRVAIGLLVVVLIGGMWGLVRWGAQEEWIPLHPQAFTADQIQRIQGELLALGGDRARVEGDRVLIRGDEQYRQQLVALLAQRGALPRDTSLGYAALIKETSVFIGDRSRVWMEHRGLETELSGVISKFSGVRDAHVFVEVPQQRGFGGKAGGSRASVHVTLSEGESLDKQRIAAIANFVVGAVSGLELKNVKITDGVRFYRPPDVAEELPTEILDIQRQAEEHHAQKIYDQLRYISGVLVNVHATLQDADEQIQEKKLGPAVVDQESSRTEEMSGPSGASGPGVRPNQGRVLADAGGGNSSTKEEADTSLKGERDARLQTTVRRAGFVQKLSASVNVPRSYLERVLSAQQAGGGASTDLSLDKIASVELPRIRDAVKPLINAVADDQVVVNWYYDMPREEKAVTQPQSAGFAALAKEHGAQAGLALLAVGSLAVVMRIARKAQVAAAPRLAPAGGGSAAGRGDDVDEEEAPLRRLGGGPATVGEVQEMESVMVGHEVDENMVRVQQIAKQIGQMIREDPASAAGIVRHWVSESN